MRLSRPRSQSAARSRQLRPTRIIILVFLAIILVATVILALPVSSREPGMTDPLTALFTATSAVSVTGMTLVDTYAHWSLFGQVVILLLVQIGGLGFMSIVSIFYFLLDKRVGLRERLVIMESMNLNEIDGVVALVRHVLFGTICFELAGTVILAGCFIPEFGLAGGLWRGLFHAVSAFCNAGFHIMGTHDMFSGVTTYSDQPVVLITMAILIIVGSTGFYVWEDIIQRRRFSRLHVHSKLVLIITGILIVLGMGMYLGLERNGSLGDMPLWEKVLVSFFQSVSTRTAGFDAIGQFTLTEDTKVLSIIFMFIGGSSGSTAGGIKTVTIGVLVLSVISVMRGRRDLVVFEKKITDAQIINAATLVSIGLILTVAGGIFISVYGDVGLIDALYETVAAYGTAGLTVGVVDTLGTAGLGLFICYMFFGKIGVLSLSIAFMMSGRSAASITYPAENVIIG